MAHAQSDMMNVSQRAFALFALAGLLVLGGARFVDFDCWHEMALAREALTIGRIPTTDSLAYTPTVDPVIHHEWGTGMVVYALAEHGGLVSMRVAQWLLLLLVGAVSWRLCRRHASPGVAAVLAPTAIVMAWAGFTVIRGLLFTLLFVAVLLAALDDDRDGRRGWIAWWLPLSVVWVNLHAGFVFGIGLVVIQAFEEAVRRRPFAHLVAVAAAMLGLIALNPYGFAYYPHLWRALTLDRSLIGEWGPIWTAPSAAGVLVYLSSVLVALYAILRNGPARSPGWMLAVVVAALALRHQRHVSLWAVVWFGLVPGWIETTALGAIVRALWQRRTIALPASAAAFALVLTADVRQRVWTLDVPANPGDLPGVVYPVGAVEYLRAHPSIRNVLVPFEYGAYVAWTLAPQVKISFDSRYEAAYPPGLLEEHVAFYAARPGWRAMLDRYPTDAVLVRRSDPVAAALAADGGWPRAYEDDAYLVFARSADGPAVDRRGERFHASFPG
jgi:hypothetical protein